MIAAVERCTRRNGGEALFTRVSTPVAVSSQTPLLATATNLLRGNMSQTTRLVSLYFVAVPRLPSEMLQSTTQALTVRRGLL